ncbi:MAG: hypothetical protein HQL07_17460 [Nitrospirae bacterium]|nr:hypothetical protein [Magnetococcales bacterium]HAT49111.1 hypothetical protein [Alphaproteobacteria bacterium]
MKKTGGLLAISAALGMVFNSGVAWSGNLDPVSGMITGALVGSIFGPDKRHRAQNALIGAVSGAFIGSQIAGADNDRSSSHSYGSRDSDWDDSYPRRHHSHHDRRHVTVIEQVPVRETIIVRPEPRTETYIVDRYGQTKVIVVEPQPTRTYITTPSDRRPRYHTIGYDR